MDQSIDITATVLDWLSDTHPEEFGELVKAWGDIGARQYNIATAFRMALEASPGWVGTIIGLEPKESLRLLRMAYTERSAIVLGRKIGPGWVGLRELVMDCMNIAAIDAGLAERKRGQAPRAVIPAAWATGKKVTAKDTAAKLASEKFIAANPQVEFGF